MSDSLAGTVAIALCLGIIFIVVFAFAFKPVTALSDAQLIAKSKQVRDVQNFLSKYPDAKVDVHRDLQKVTIAYGISKQFSDPTSIYPDGITRTRMLAIIFTNSSTDGAADLRLYCAGIPETLSTPAFGREGDMIGRIDNEGCFGEG